MTNNEESPENVQLNRKGINIFGLNDYCLRKICKYCSVVDLFNMCIASDEMKIRSLDSGLRGRMIDFTELGDCCHILDVFKIFGQHMTKIIIGEKDIQYKQRKLSKFDEILLYV